MSAAAGIQSQIAAEQRNYQARLSDLQAQDQRIGAKFGVNASGQLDFINPADPFSITGNLKRLFREQDASQKYGAAASGGFYDGATGEEAGKLGIQHLQQQRETTDQFNEAKAGVASQKVGVEGDFRSGSASLQSQLAQAFADDSAATLSPAAPAGAAAGEAAPAAAPGAAGVHEFKRVGGVLYRRLKGTNQQWVKVPGR